MEKILQVIQCSDEEKVNLASYMLQDRADEWWQTARRNAFEGKAIITWDEFLEKFREKFFSDFARDQMELEFLQLHQGILSTEQYDVKFQNW